MVKLIRAGLMSAVMVVLICGGVFAASAFYPQGSIVVPSLTFHRSDIYHYSLPYIILSNVTGDSVQCKVALYDHNGVDISTMGVVYTGGVPTLQQISAGTGMFNIPAHSTRVFSLNLNVGNQYVYGHAVVEWTSDDPKARYSLVGGVLSLRRKGAAEVASSHFLINNGQPF